MQPTKSNKRSRWVWVHKVRVEFPPLLMGGMETTAVAAHTGGEEAIKEGSSMCGHEGRVGGVI